VHFDFSILSSINFVLFKPQLSKTADGIKVVTDKGEELIADVVLFATGI
jgi:hypothetical protein